MGSQHFDHCDDKIYIFHDQSTDHAKPLWICYIEMSIIYKSSLTLECRMDQSVLVKTMGRAED